MAEIINRTEVLHQKSISSAMIASEYHYNEWESKILLVRDKISRKWGPPSGGQETHNGISELPHETIQREWIQETTLPFIFKDKIQLDEVVMYRALNKTSIGFIYKAYLTPEVIKKLSEPLKITSDEDVDLVKLFNYKETLNLLTNWEDSVRFPEKNAINIIKWCNSVLGRSNGPLPESLGYHPYTMKDFNMNFETYSLFDLARDMEFHSE